MAKVKEIVEGTKKSFFLVLVGIFLIIAILLYGFEPREEPKRVAFNTQGGGVIFDHQVHVDLKNMLCEDCHHNFNDAVNNLSANCRGCHYGKELKDSCQNEPVHKNCIGSSCTGCHMARSVNCKFCHNAEPSPSPPIPDKVEFETDGGQVVFDHKTHASADGYDLGCDTCHHGYQPGNKNFPMNCRRCHYNAKYKSICENEDTHVRCIGKKCVDCHTDGAEDCGICHKE